MDKYSAIERKINLMSFVIVTLIGVISSIVIGLYFKGIESLYDIKVYTLLLNVDYFPILKKYQFHEVIEFSFHVFVSIIIIIFLLVAQQKLNWTRRQTMRSIIMISVVIGIVIYPTTMLSERTPQLFSIAAFTHWLIGHLLFGITVAFCFKLFNRK